MNVANKELCKELYDVSGWGDGPDMQKLDWLDYYDSWSVPAYPLGYLLRKLPDGSYLSKGKRLYTASTGNYKAGQNPFPYTLHADTPEDALCQLAIELFKQGVLK